MVFIIKDAGKGFHQKIKEYWTRLSLISFSLWKFGDFCVLFQTCGFFYFKGCLVNSYSLYKYWSLDQIILLGSQHICLILLFAPPFCVLYFKKGSEANCPGNDQWIPLCFWFSCYTTPLNVTSECWPQHIFHEIQIYNHEKDIRS